MGKPEYMLTDEGTIVWLIEIQIDSSLFQAHIFQIYILSTQVPTQTVLHIAWHGLRRHVPEMVGLGLNWDLLSDMEN